MARSGTGNISEAPSITIERVTRTNLQVPIIGTSPLIMHKWSAKARLEMLGRQQGKSKQKQFRDPEAEFEDAIYYLPDGTGPNGEPIKRYGFPAVAFKSAIVDATRNYGKDVTMVQARISIFVAGVGPDMLVPLDVPAAPVMREDVVRVGMGSADLRYRPMFEKWAATLDVSFAPPFSGESVLALIDAGGAGGVGEWRPEKNGVYGTFELAV